MWWMLVASALGAPPEPVARVVTRVDVVGEARLEEVALRAALSLAPGDVATVAAVRRDLKALWATGWLLDIAVHQVDDGEGTALIWEIQERPTLQAVRWLDVAERDQEAWAEVVALKPGRPLSPSDEHAAVERLETHLAAEGWLHATVSARRAVAGRGLEELVLAVDTGRKVSVEVVTIVGAPEELSDPWRASLSTRPALILPLGKSGRFDPAALQADADALRWMMVEDGYVDAEVKKPAAWLSPDRRTVRVQFEVVPGPLYRLGEIAISGALAPESGITEEVLLALARGASVEAVEEAQWREAVGRAPPRPAASGGGLETGEVFAATATWAAARRVERLLGDRGYGLASVTPVPHTHPAQGMVDIALVVELGAITRVRAIHIRGNVETLDTVVRRELAVFEGGLLRTSELDESERRLMRTGWYEKVVIAAVPTDDPGLVDLDVEVFERPTGTLSAGLGYEGVGGPQLNLAYHQDNTLGTGVAVDAQIVASVARQNIQLSTTQPRINHGPWSVSGWTNLRHDTLVESVASRSAGLTLGRALGRQELWSVAATASSSRAAYYNITPTQKRLLGGDLYRGGLTNEVSAMLQHDTRDDRRLPTRGHVITTRASFAGGARLPDGRFLSVLGGEHSLAEGVVDLRGYARVLPSDPRFVLRGRSRVQAITATDGGTVPISRRYRPGGVQDIRGYNPLSLGPTTTLGLDDDPLSESRTTNVGGTVSWINNVELEARFMPRASVVVFGDVGGSWGSPVGLPATGSGLHSAVGAGLRLSTPMGLIRLEAAVPLNPLPGSKPVEFHLGMGTNF